MNIKNLENKCLKPILYSVYGNDLCGDTLQDLLSNMVGYINEVIGQTNDNTKLVQGLYDYVRNEGLKQEVIDEIRKMIDDGTFEQIINQEIFGDLTDDIINVRNELEDTKTSLKGDIDIVTNNLNKSIETRKDLFVSIEEFGGSTDITDNSVALQKAIDYVYSKGGGTVFIPSGTYYFRGIENSNMVTLKSKVNILGCGKDISIFKIADDNGDWNVMLGYESGVVQHDITIKGLTFDCNIVNTGLKYPKTFVNARCLIRFGEGYNLNLLSNKFIYNGIWASRGKNDFGVIKDNEVIFDSSSYEDLGFDTSALLFSGRSLRIQDNYIWSKGVGPKSSAPATPIECQGHNVIVTGNICKYFKLGILMSGSTFFENSFYRPTDFPNGNHGSIISNNSIVAKFYGITIWPMNLPKGSLFTDLIISNNSVVVDNSDIPSGFYAKGIRFYTNEKSESGVEGHNGNQTCDFRNILIEGNTFRFTVRRPNTTLDKGEHGIRLWNDYNVTNISIKNNIFDNIGGYGIYVGSQINDLSGDGLNTQVYTIGLDIQGNTFNECVNPIKFGKNVKCATIRNNIFRQQIYYTQYVTANMINCIDIDFNQDGIDNIIIEDNSVQGCVNVKPFIPSVYRPSIGLCNNTNLKPSGKDIMVVEPYEGKITIDSTQYIRRSDNKLYKSRYTNGATITRTNEIISTVTELVNSKRIKLSDTSKIEPNDLLLLNADRFESTQVVVQAVIGDEVLLLNSTSLKPNQEAGGNVYYYMQLDEVL